MINSGVEIVEYVPQSALECTLKKWLRKGKMTMIQMHYMIVLSVALHANVIEMMIHII